MSKTGLSRGVRTMTPRRDYVDYFSFRWLISPTVIKVVYILGALAITSWGVFTIVGAFSARTYFGGNEILWLGFLWGAAILIFGNLLWRLLCEFCIVAFQMAEEIAEMRYSMPEALRDLKKPLEATTQKFQEGVRELSAIKEELREGISYTRLQETLTSLVTQFERGTAQFAAVAEGLQEEFSRSELPGALRAVARRLEEGTERLVHLEEKLQEHFHSSPAISGRAASLEGTVEAKEANTLAAAASPSHPGAGVRAFGLKGALVVLGSLSILGIGVFVGVPLAAGVSELHGFDPQSLGDLFSSAWNYWLTLLRRGN